MVSRLLPARTSASASSCGVRAGCEPREFSATSSARACTVMRKQCTDFAACKDVALRPGEALRVCETTIP